MNKKLIKTIASITCGLGIATSIPFAATSCGKKEQHKLECDSDTIPGNIMGNAYSEITPTVSLSGHIKTDTGESVSGVTFSCEGLTEQTGLIINQTTGVISGTLTKKPTNPNFKIKFTANVDGVSLEGYSNTFTITLNPTLKCDSDTIPGNIIGNAYSEITPTASLSGHIKTDTGESVSGVTFSCEGLTEQTGLIINQTTGVISGTLTKKPTNPNFKIKFTANVDGVFLEGYSKTFTITINPTRLECDSDTIPGNIIGNAYSEITPTVSLSGHIKTDTGESLSGVTFACEGLPNGLSINQSTGVISGTPTEEIISQQYIVTFTASINGKTLTGQIDKFNTSIGPKIPSSLTSDVRIFDEIRSTTMNVLTEELSGHIKTDTGVVVNKADHGLCFTISQGSLPSGLSFNSNTGVISGKCATSGTYKFKITANATVNGVSLSYETDEFSITISDTILPDTVYKYSDTKKTKLTGFTDEFLNNPNTYSVCDTMQIVRNVASIDNNAFFSISTESSIPSFIKKLVFTEGSSCSSIGDDAFSECWSFTSITLPNSIVSIGRDVFLACTKLETLDLSRCTNLTSIDRLAFGNCVALTTIHWNLPTKYSTTITISNDRTFQKVPAGGTFKCSTSGVNLNDLKTWLEGKGFPTGWTFTQ